MKTGELHRLLTSLRSLPKETEWVEILGGHLKVGGITNKQVTNGSLRKRFSIADKNYPIASRIIGDTVEVGLIKPYDPESTSKKHARYVPFWA